MKKDTSKSSGGLFQRIREKIAGQKVAEPDEVKELSNEETQQMLEDFEAVVNHTGPITGWDFDRAFDFIEQYPDSPQAEILIGQMYSTTPQSLKGLSYSSAVKVMERMPGHSGRDAIIRGMYKLEKDYIKELKSDVIAYMLKNIPDHPLADELTTALAVKNLTRAYDFVTADPENVYSKAIIKAMFERDPNIALLLLQEKMDHPHVASIFDGIYNITDDAVIEKLTPNAIILVLDVAPDHPKVRKMIEVLVESNYVKAFDFVSVHSDHSLAETIKELILERKPELKKLIDEIGAPQKAA